MATLLGLIAETIAPIGYLDAKEAAKENLEMCITVWNLIRDQDGDEEAQFLAFTAGMANAMNMGFKLGKER